MNPLQWLSPVITSPDVWLASIFIMWIIYTALAIRAEQIVDSMKAEMINEHIAMDNSNYIEL